MKFFETELKCSYIIELEKLEDERGFFSRSWDRNEFKEQGLNHNLVQCNISFSKKKGTLRGMHFQKKPFEETKLVRCTRGKIFDVIIDLRAESNTYKKWIGMELKSDDFKIILSLPLVSINAISIPSADVPLMSPKAIKFFEFFISKFKN